jgi:protein MpaA
MCVLLALAAIGCGSENHREIAPPPAPARDSSAMNESREIVLGRSVKGTPITMRVFGEGAQSIFILGGIHGDETTAVDLTTNLIALLEAHPEMAAGKRIAIIRVANPDGYAAKKRVNAHGVDLNRNFPASNFHGSRRYGNASASEPETQALLSALDQLQPSLIISIHSIDGERECNNYDGPAEDVAKRMSTYNRYPVAPNIGYPTPGSMGTYCGIDRKIPMITLELPRGTSGEESWERNREALIAAIRSPQ